MPNISWQSKVIYFGFSIFIVVTTLMGWQWDNNGLLERILYIWIIIWPIAGALLDMFGIKSFGEFCLVALVWFSVWGVSMFLFFAVSILSHAGFGK